VAITRLAALPPEARDRLFGLGREDLKRLARAFSEAELESLARYLDGLEPVPRARVLAAVAATPGKLQGRAAPRVRNAVLASRDQARAVDMMLRDGSGSPEVILDDARAAWEGQVAPVLIWEKHPVIVIGLGLAAV